jgi:hypothetical protein
MLERSPEFSEDSFRMVFAHGTPAFLDSWLDGLREAGWEG